MNENSQLQSQIERMIKKANETIEKHRRSENETMVAGSRTEFIFRKMKIRGG